MEIISFVYPFLVIFVTMQAEISLIMDSLYLQYSSVLCSQLEITCDLWDLDGEKYFNIVNPNIHLVCERKIENK